MEMGKKYSKFTVPKPVLPKKEKMERRKTEQFFDFSYAVCYLC